MPTPAGRPSAPTTVRERLQQAAFALFDEQGYDGTTVDAIAERAGVGRTTFFRAFRSKEDVIFPHHDELLEQVQARLDAASSRHSLLAVSEATRLVLRHYLAEGELARRRYELTRSVPSLREREIAGMQQYLRVFREYIRTWMDDELRAELMAGSIVTAHNVVLRRWLRGQSEDAHADFDAAIAQVLDLFADRGERDGRSGATVVVVPGYDDPSAVAAAVEQALREQAPRG
ncbi:TetR family transcriptional regulator [Nocardioides sp. ChNu-153]|uniref:TetR/AcrR family transcriptional regulator n=1 Tax=unclassified Nocardioides TaxID=2615069 RepID=UPI0024075239|nr:MULTISPECIES: TetR/AcrR family transcriptional regulator [unclassified Nocardioides]MDF9717167.1 TetR/AcrR family transcriptional regulator [Nocardioides sp. ChNu-99]MDN7120481.1 TetR family transcriptional regulator [Nocardioides sp. ChNu-153]